MTIQLKTRPTDRVIELGGGSHPLIHPNVDVRPCFDANGNPTVDFTADFHEPLPIQSEDFHAVFSQFVIEHIAYPKVPQFVSEIFRILKPGGKAVIITANTEAQLKWVLEHPEGWDGKEMLESASCKLFGDQQHGEREGDKNYGYDSHKTYFSPAVLVKLFQDAGFVDLVLTPYGERGTDIVVEAVKPQGHPQREMVKFAEAAEIEADALFAAGPSYVEQQVKKEFLPGSPVNPIPPEQLFDRHYFNGGSKVGGYIPWYWDYPCHEITARHVLSRRPESVLELGCARGYVLKRIQDAGVPAIGLEVSKHCHMTAVANAIIRYDLIKTSWPIPLDRGLYDLCFSVAVLDHIPEEHLPTVLKEMARVSKRGLHGINFGPVGDDKTRVTCRPKEWWGELFNRCIPKDSSFNWEIVDKNELENGTFPEDVFRGDGKIKLNIGCAQTMFHYGWVNIDVFDHGPWAQGNGYQYQKHDVRNVIPWGTGHVDLIYCGHMLEHLSYREGLSFLRDCRRVLKPDTGAMRIIVPDAAKLMGLYVGTEDWGNSSLTDFDEVNEGCANAPTAAGKLYALLHEGHHAVYDTETLNGMLWGAGFNSSTVEFRRGASTQMLKETLDTHPALSLYVDAVPRRG